MNFMIAMPRLAKNAAITAFAACSPSAIASHRRRVCASALCDEGVEEPLLDRIVGRGCFRVPLHRYDPTFGKLEAFVDAVIRPRSGHRLGREILHRLMV